MVTLVAVACGGSPSTETTDGAGATTTTTVPNSGFVSDDAGLTGLDAELSVIRAANEGRLPLSDALDFFASTFGEMPGSDDLRFEGRAGDGTMALMAVLAHWEELSPEQQQAVRSYLGYSSAQSFLAPAAVGPDADDLALQADIDSARAAIAGFVGTDLTFPIRGEMVPGLTGVLPGDTEPSPIAGVTWPERGGDVALSGRPDVCRVQFSTDEVLSPTTVAHEVFHCFQYQLGPDLADAIASAAWIIEGSAEWAGAKVSGVDGGVIDHFEQWVQNTDSLFGLSYGAVGYFWVLESMGVNPWSVIGEMLATEGTEAVAASGFEPGDVLRRVASSLARRQQAPTLPVSGVWDFAAAGVPPGGVRVPLTVTPDTPFVNSQVRGGFVRGAEILFTLEGGERVQVEVDSDVGTIEFYGKDAIVWDGRLNREFCLEDGGCRCGVDGEVDPGLGIGSREMILAGGELGGGPITYLVRIPDPEGAFTDGHWEGMITSSVFEVSTDGTTGTRHETSAAIEFTVENGAVTSGAYAVSYFINFANDGGGTGEGTSTVTGRFTGCGFAPQLYGTGFSLDAILHLPEVGDVPLVFSQTIDSPPIGPTLWVTDPVTDPNRRTGQIDPIAELEYLRSSGYGASDVVFTFEATRTG